MCQAVRSSKFFQHEIATLRQIETCGKWSGNLEFREWVLDSEAENFVCPRTARFTFAHMENGKMFVYAVVDADEPEVEFSIVLMTHVTWLTSRMPHEQRVKYQCAGKVFRDSECQMVLVVPTSEVKL